MRDDRADTMDWFDDDGYPTEGALGRIREWGLDDWHGLLAFVRSIWWHGESLVEHSGDHYWLHTGGWSGNEDIIEALHSAGGQVFWLSCWRSSHTGGHYHFKFKVRP